MKIVVKKGYTDQYLQRTTAVFVLDIKQHKLFYSEIGLGPNDYTHRKLTNHLLALTVPHTSLHTNQQFLLQFLLDLHVLVHSIHSNVRFRLLLKIDNGNYAFITTC